MGEAKEAGGEWEIRLRLMGDGARLLLLMEDGEGGRDEADE